MHVFHRCASPQIAKSIFLNHKSENFKKCTKGPFLSPAGCHTQPDHSAE
jgi:hypothetical protein